jgi:hypothetical protein
MALEFDQPKENEQYVKYVYDDKDRLILRNVYQADVNYSGIRRNRNYKKPKKLLYQDLYTYRNSQTPDYCRRIYQPNIAPPTGTRVGSTVSFETNIISKSKVLASGFMWYTEKDLLMKKAQYPDYNALYRSSGSANNKTFAEDTNNVGKLNHTITSASTVYVKAYCMLETGILFSKTLTL